MVAIKTNAKVPMESVKVPELVKLVIIKMGKMPVLFVVAIKTNAKVPMESVKVPELVKLVIIKMGKMPVLIVESTVKFVQVTLFVQNARMVFI